eukprot:TRINITY_DN7881_c0_g3_i1.p1 TRINITY_DN7881_c0_g3~~TRINITY_DN7881_c0_g3_i1.p1  ORF type:complete len:362 (+),score=113.49 TRINITY_DN7881_c0_g3_i1:104-1189(+)
MGEMLSSNTTLRKLNVDGNTLGVEGFCALIEGATTSRIERLSASGIGCGNKGGHCIGDLLAVNTSLKWLSLAANDIALEGGDAMFSELKDNTTLEYLDLIANFDIIDQYRFCWMLNENTTLRSILIGFCGIDDDVADSIGKSLVKNKGLTELDISNNEMTEGALYAFYDVLRFNTTLQDLSLGIETRNNWPIFDALRENKTLTSIELTSGSDGEENLCEALLQNTTLKNLVLEDFDATDDAVVQQLIKALECNKTLQTLNLGHLKTSAEGKKALAKHLELGDNGTNLWKVKHSWSKESHHRFPKAIRDQVFQLILMWNHDQYEAGECDDFPWNELPLEVLFRIIQFMTWDRDPKLEQELID